MLIQKFLEFEQKYNLFEKRIDEFPYWQFIRFSVYSELKKNIYKSKLQFRKNKNTLYKIVSILLKAAIYNSHFRIKSKDIVFISHPRRVLVDDFYKCIFTDSLFDYYKENSIVLENVYNGTHMKPLQPSNIFYLDNLYLRTRASFLLKKICKKRTRFSEVVKFLK